MGITGRTFSITNYTARFKKNDSNSEKTYIATFDVGDGKTHTFTITQDGKETVVKDFKWSNGETSIDKDASANTKYIQESYTMSGYILSDLTVTCDTDECSGRLDSSGTFVGSITTNTETTQRDIVFNIVYEGETIATLTVKQTGKPEEKYFWLAESGKTGYTTDLLDATATSCSVIYLTNYDESEVANFTSASTQSWIKSVSFNGGTVTVTIDANDTTGKKNGSVSIKNDIQIIGTINIKQNAADRSFAWDNGQSAKTLSNFTETTFTEAYTTNYNSLTIEYTDNVSTATLSNVNGSGNANGSVNPNQETSAITSYVRVKSNGVLIGELTIVQPAAEEKYFWINAEGTKDYDIPEFDANVSCAQTPYDVTIITNYSYDNINFEYGGFLDNVVLASDLSKVSFTFRENTGVERTAKITFYTGNTLTSESTLGTISLKQNGVVEKVFAWRSNDYDTPTLDITVLANVTGYDVTYYSTYSENLSLESDNYGIVITAFSPTALTATTGETLGSLHFDFIENISTTSNQVDYIRVRDINNNVVGTIKLTQMPKENVTDWYKWIVSGVDMGEIYTVPEIVPKEGSECKFYFRTNVEGFSYVSDDMSVFDGGIDIVWDPGYPDGYCKFTLTPNTEENNRNIIIFAKKDDTKQSIGKLILTQEGTPVEKYIWIEQTEQSAVTYNAPYTATLPVYTIITNYKTTELNSLIKVISPSDIGWVKDVTLNKTSLTFNVEKNEDKNNTRSCNIVIKNLENTELIKVFVNQEKNNDKDFKWTYGDVVSFSSTTVTSDSGDTEEGGVDVTVTYETDYDNLRVEVDSETYPWIKNVNLDTTLNAVTYHLDVRITYDVLVADKAINLYSDNKLIGTITVKQYPAPEPDKYFYLLYNEIIEQENNLIIDNVPAVLSEQTRQFVVTAQTNIPLSQFTVVADEYLGREWITGVTKNNMSETSFTITFIVKDNSLESIRTGYVNILRTKDGNTSLHRQIQINQKAMKYEFSWVEGAEPPVTNKEIGPLGTGSTSSSVPFYTTYSNIQVAPPSTQNGMTCSINGRNAVYNVNARGATEYDDRSATFTLISGNNPVGTLKITQKGQVSPLTFKWNNGSNYKEVNIDYNTKIFEEPYTVSSEEYILYVFPDTTNPNGFHPTEKKYVFSTGVINFTADTYNTETSSIRTAKFYVKGNTTPDVTYDSPTYGTFVINQTPKPYFYWGSGTDSDLTKNINQTGTTGNGEKVYYRTNMNGLTLDPSRTTQYQNVAFGEDNVGTFVIINATANVQLGEKSESFSIKKGSDTVGSLTIKQTGNQAYLIWDGTNSSSYTMTDAEKIPATGGSYSKEFESNCPNITLVGTKPAWVVSSGITSEGNYKYTFKVTGNSTDNIDGNEYTFQISGQTASTSSYKAVVGDITIKQTGAEPHFEWSVGTGIGTTATTTGTSNTNLSYNYLDFETNYKNLNYSIISDPSNMVNSDTSVSSSRMTLWINKNETQSSRIAELYVTSNGSTNIGKVTFTQEAPTEYFAWGSSSGPSSTAITVSSSNIGSKSYYTTYTGLTLVFSEGVDLIQSSGFSTSSFNVTASTNTETSQRSGTYIVKGKWNDVEKNIGTITINQNGASAWFTWSNGETGDTKEDFPATGGSFTEGYLTNDSTPSTTYTLSGDTTKTTFGWDTSNNQITGTVIANTSTAQTKTYYIYVKKGSSRIATLTIKQKKAEVQNQFSWNASSIVTATTGTNIDGTGSTETQNYYVTGYTSLSCSSNQTWLKCKISNTSGNGTLTYSAATQSEGASSRNGVITISSNSSPIGELQVTQDGRSVTYSIVAYTGTSGTATATTVNSGSTSFAARVITENQGWSVDTSLTDDWLSATPSSTGSSGTKSVTINVEANDSTSNRTGYIYFNGSERGSDSLKVTQEAKYVPPVTKVFEWSNGDTAITPTTVAATGGTVSVDYTNTYTLSGSVYGTATWIPTADRTLSNLTGDGTFSATVSPNASTSSRSVTLQIRTGSTTLTKVGEITINQAAAEATRTVTVKSNNWSINNVSASIGALGIELSAAITYPSATNQISGNVTIDNTGTFTLPLTGYTSSKTLTITGVTTAATTLSLTLRFTTNNVRAMKLHPISGFDGYIAYQDYPFDGDECVVTVTISLSAGSISVTKTIPGGLWDLMDN